MAVFDSIKNSVITASSLKTDQPVMCFVVN